MTTLNPIGTRDSFYQFYKEDPSIEITRRRIDFYATESEEEYYNVAETVTIRNRGVEPVEEFYLNVEQFRINLVVLDSDQVELPFIPRENITEETKIGDMPESDAIKRYGILLIKLPFGRELKGHETRVIFLKYIYPYGNWYAGYNAGRLGRVARRVVEWFRDMFFNIDITYYVFNVFSIDHIYFSLRGSAASTTEPLFIFNMEEKETNLVYFDGLDPSRSIDSPRGKGYFTFHLSNNSKRLLGLTGLTMLVFISKPERVRAWLVRSFTTIITLNALIVCVYEYRFLIQNLGQESSAFLLMLSLLIAVFTLSLLPIPSRPIKFRNVVLYASGWIFATFVIPLYYILSNYIWPWLIIHVFSVLVYI